MITFTEQRNLLKIGDFRERVIQSILTAALAIQTEDPSTEHHENRVQLAKAVTMNAAGMEPRFSEVLVTQMASTEPSDAEISDAVAGVWDMVALAMFPE